MDQQTVSVLHYAGPPVVGGVESTIEHHARLLTEFGYHVNIIAGRGQQPAANIDFIKIELLDSRHSSILEVGAELAQGKVSDEFKFLRDQIIQELQPYLEQSDFVIVHNVITLHKNLPFTAALFEFSRQGQRLIAWCHDFAWRDELYTNSLHPGYPWQLMSQPWENVIYVVVSEDRRMKLAELLEISSDVIKVITPGVDWIRFQGISPEVGRIVSQANLLNAQPLLMLPARITRRKNIELAIEITYHLNKLMPDAKLIITGPPGAHNPTNIDYLHRLLTLRQELGLQQHIHFLYQFGEKDEPLDLSDQMIAELYRLADALLFPSKREGFGIPVLEAGLSRLPVFAADIPPVRESSGLHAYLFDLHTASPASIAKDIAEQLRRDDAYQLRRRVLNNFTWQAIIKSRILPLFEQMRTQND